MLRLMLKDEFWSKLEEIMLQHGIYGKPNLYIGSTSDIIKQVWEHNNKSFLALLQSITYLRLFMVKCIPYILKQPVAKNVSKIGQDKGKLI